MRTLNKSTYIVLLSLSFLVLLAAKCGTDPEEITEVEHPKAYLNLGDSAHYVGKQVCAQCHAGHAETFSHTGMGMSFDTVSKVKSAGHFSGHKVLYDAFKNFYYQPFWRGDSLVVKEFRLEKNDTVYQQTHSINYIIGSGQHTNSHMFVENGYVFQVPFTVYTQSGKLDFPPGFENGNNSRFSRPIGLECMSCHNAMPTKFVAGSENKFDFIPKGIDCERCHGPGSLHVEKIGRGEITDTANHIDWSIVNPRKMEVDLQMELCQRCHLQGNAVLAEGKSFLDFKPGMYLDSVMDVYLPRYENSDDQFIMASHVDRLKMSKCFVAGKGSFNCISCHNPHVSVRETNTDIFNAACKSCHSNEKTNFGCNRVIKHLDDNNCVDCHMPQSGSIDIPHVSVHDHYIRVPEEKQKELLEKGAFLGLKAINNPNPSPRSRVNAYLQQFERFEKKQVFLDSAEALLKKQPQNTFGTEWIHLFYLQNRPSDVVKWVEAHGKARAWLNTLSTKSLSNTDAWTAYRIAESFRKFSDYAVASQFIDQAVELAPYHLEFRIKKASILALMQNFVEAEKEYLFVLKQNSRLAEAWSDLGYVQLALSNNFDAEKSCKKALALDPDYQRAKVNLASVYLANQEYGLARKWLNEVLKTDPENKRVNAALDYLNENKLE